MYVIVGLGNPEKKYEHTRHNVGFDVLSVLSAQLNIPITKSRCKSLVGEGMIGTERVALAAPQTYMNLSGEAVVQLINWYKIKPSQLIVVYDDVDLDAGKLRIRGNGSAGTHNGMRSIIGLTGQQGFPRVRVGIGRPPHPNMDLADYVLGKYPKEQQQTMFDAFTRAAEAVQEIVKNGTDKAQAKFNG